MIDNKELVDVLEVLENLEDEQEAARLLKEFNDRTKALGQLVLNLDPDLDHDEWKKRCDQAQIEVDQILEEIFSYR